MSTEGNPTNPELSDEEQFAEFLKQSEEAEQAPQTEPEPEPEQEPETPPETTPVAAQTQAQPAADDWLSKVPDDVRERVRQEIETREKAARDFENRWKAQSGQLGPTQKKLAELERQLRESQTKQTAAQSAGMTEDAWARYEREFPEESAAFKARLNPLQEQVQTMAQQLAEWQEEREFNQAAQQLAKEHPDWQQLDNDPVFGEWFDAQPDVVKEMFPEGQRASPKHVAWLVGEFKKAEKMAELWEKSQQPAPAQASPKATAVAARREQQKRDPIVGIRTGQSAPAGRRNATGSYPGEDEFAAFLEANPP